MALKGKQLAAIYVRTYLPPLGPNRHLPLFLSFAALLWAAYAAGSWLAA